MIKHIEIIDSNSCWNKARDNERIFVLLERDLASPTTIRFWCNERVRLGKNVWTDKQIISAMECADLIEKIQNNVISEYDL